MPSPSRPQRPRALVGARLAHGLDRQPLELRARAVAADAREPRVDHEPHARDRQRRLRDVGREHDATTFVAREHAILVRAREPAVQRQHVPGDAAAHEHVARLEDLLLARQEHERVATDAARLALEFLQCVADRLRQRRRRLVFLRERPVAHLDRERAALHVDHRRAVEVVGEALRLDRGRGHDEAKVGASRQQPLADAEQEIDVEVALVRLVEDQRVVAQQQRVALEFPQQQAVGHQLDQRPRTGAVDETHLVPDEVAGRRCRVPR